MSAAPVSEARDSLPGGESIVVVPRVMEDQEIGFAVDATSGQIS